MVVRRKRRNTGMEETNGKAGVEEVIGDWREKGGWEEGEEGGTGEGEGIEEVQKGGLREREMEKK